MSTANSLYITLNHLRFEAGHWGLFATGSAPPAGTLYHATDTQREALDLRLEVHPVKNPQASKTMVVALKIADSPGPNILQHFTSTNVVHLMHPGSLPVGEDFWTCRVWVKEVLQKLNKSGHIRLPTDIDTIQRRCQFTADHNFQYKGHAKIYNNLSWISGSGAVGTAGGSSSRHRTTMMDIDTTGRHPYHGTKPMLIDSTGQHPYHGTKPMLIDSTGRHPYHGTQPMDTGKRRRHYG
ncbi:hypothetical protein EVJ58_g10133 [Rhodofomes roseus]|uniref:Uncharacterized protein n=1 Tax=Rhodofomes roseus TaxID=34475 RepID=A0A4Y9XQ44_9APHY|nr:hypothetical protein EVJ58_g10133 [Rhodofomes roseus]